MSNPSAPTTQMFSVDVNGETVAETWNQAVPMPAHLAERVDTLSKRHHSTSPTEMENKMQQAAQNYKENLENTRSKAHMATAKGAKAKERRAEFGENMALMGNAMGNKDQSIKLPKSLAKRVDRLAPAKTSKDSLMSKQAKAGANRKAALEKTQAKASASTAKVAAAKARKEASAREAQGATGQFFEVDAGVDDNSTNGGWGAKVPLPAHLSERVREVSKQFEYDVSEREARTATNHQMQLDAKAAKAKLASERVEAAKQRRFLAKGDENHFTITADKETDDLNSAFGFAGKPPLPAHLQKRLSSLQGKFHSASPNTRQERAAEHRVKFNADIAAKGRQSTLKNEASARRRALATGDANTHFTVSEATFAASEEAVLENNNGWGVQQSQKLPGRLQNRLAKMNFGPKEDMETRQARAAMKRTEFLASIAAKASMETDRVEKANAQKKLMEGDANTFTVSFGDAEKEVVDAKQGWSAKPSLPKALQDRYASLRKTSTTTLSDIATKQDRANANRLAFQSDIVAKASVESEKMANAASRRAVAKGDPNTLYSISASEEADASGQAGWGAAKSMPSHLRERLDTLQEQFKKKPQSVRQEEAATRRAEFLRDVASRASAETDKMHNALNRKQLEAGDANTFTVSLSDTAAGDAKDSTGWRQRNRLPARLQERLKELGETFQMQPYQARAKRAEVSRTKFLTSIADKASAETDKIAAAESRRMLATGDATHFTVAATEDEDAVVQQQGWGYKPPMPTRLQQRLSALNSKTSKNKETLEARQASAEIRRQAFTARVVAKAAVATEKSASAKSRKAIVQGSAMFFSAEVGTGGEEKEEKNNTEGWGVPTSLPARLEARYKSLNAKHHGCDPMAKQRAADARRAKHLKAIQFKAHESVDRMLACQSRKSLAEGNEACFRVEFEEESKGTTTSKQGWGPGSPALPKRLARRAAEMIKLSPTKNPFEAMNKATENRDEYLATLVAKAKQTSMKMEAARMRKLRSEMEAGIILINTKDQRKLSPVKLPTRLSERVEALTARFGYDGAEREVRVAENRQRRLMEIRNKAAASSERNAAAKQRRMLLARQQQLERIQNPGAATTSVGLDDMEDEDGACSKTRKSCTIC